jgi:hypothetical protein
MLLPIPSPAPGVVINNDTSTASVRYPVFAAITNGQAVKEYVSSSKLYYVPSTGVLNATSFAGAGTGLTGTAASLSIGGNAATATLATAATNLAGGVANNMAYQTGAGATAFITAPSTSGSYLQWTSVGGFAWTPFSGVTSFSAGTTGFTPNVSTTGAITLAGTLGASNGGTGATTLTGYVYGNGVGVMTASATIPNTAISGLGSMSTQNANSVAITGGSIDGATIGGSVAAAGSFTTLGGTTITASTQFTGPGTKLTGTAASLSIGGTAALATSLAAGSTYSIPYQSAAGTTAFLAAGTSGSILMTLGSVSAPIWISAAALSVASANNLVGGNSGYVPYQSAASTTAFVSAGTTGQVFTSGGTGSPTWTSQSALSVGTATNIAGGLANQINYQTTAGVTGFITAPTTASTYLQWSGSAFIWVPISAVGISAVTGTAPITVTTTSGTANVSLASSVYTAPGTIGSVTPNTGAFTTLSASSTVSGTGFSNYLASPPAIGNTTPNAGTFTALVATSITDSGLTAGRVNYNGVGGLLTDSANLTFDGSTVTALNTAYTGTLTGSTGVVNLGSGQFYKDASGNVSIGGTDASYGKLSVRNGYIYVNEDGINTSQIYIRTNFGGQPAIQVATTNPLLFATNNIERMRIDSSGNWMLGTTSPLGLATIWRTSNGVNLQITNTSSTFTSPIIQASGYATGSNSWYALVCQSGNGSAVTTNTCIIYGSGNIANLNNSYGAISDIKLKENIVDATPKLDDLMKVKVRNYNLKADQTHKQIGVIAQELEEIFPALVEEAPDRDMEGNDLGTVTKQVKYSVFVPMLIKAIQEQQALIENLTTRLTALENK